MNNVEIGNKIKYARTLRDLTLDDIAKKVGVTKSTIQRYENGKIFTIKLPVVEAIAIALNVNPAWVVGKSNDMELPTQKVPKILEYYAILNDVGKCKAIERVKELTYVPEYIGENKEDMEIAEEIQPHFTTVEEAEEYLNSYISVAALAKKYNSFSKLDLANILYASNYKNEGDDIIGD